MLFYNLIARFAIQHRRIPFPAVGESGLPSEGKQICQSDSSSILSFHQGFLRSFLTIFMQILGVEETPWAAPYFKKSEVNIFDEQEKGLVLLRPAHSASPHVLLFSVERNTTYTVSIHL